VTILRKNHRYVLYEIDCVRVGHFLAQFACFESQFVLPALDNQHVSDCKPCSPVEAMLYVAVALIYLCVNYVLKLIYY
jgi:hypothetical protein